MDCIARTHTQLSRTVHPNPLGNGDTERLSSKPLAAVLRGEGLAWGVMFSESFPPHSRPLSPEYGGEGLWGQSLR